MIKKLKYYLLKPIFFIGTFVCLQQLIELKTRGFCLQKIRADDLGYHQRWEAEPLPYEEQKTINALLSQPYHFLGAGSECFAFASEDGQVVIKFFKLDLMRPVYLQRGLFKEDYSAFAGTISDLQVPGQALESVLKRLFGIREFRIWRTFSSLKLSYDDLKEETGLIYLHLNPTNHLRKTLTIYDPCGIAHLVDLDTTHFFLQKKATPLEAHFSALRKSGQDLKAQRCIDSLISLFLRRCQKGYADRDILNRNLGFIDESAIEIDSGSFLKNPRMKQPWVYKQEIFYATLELKSWFKRNYPQMVDYLEQRVSEEISKNA